MAKNKKWFIKVRGSYLPNSWQGWLTYIPFVAFLIAVLKFVAQSDYSVALILLIIFPNFICAGIVMNWIASQKS